MPRTLLAFLLLLFLASTAVAGDWRVIPIRMFLGPQIKNDSVRLINNGSEPLNLQAKATVWSQDAQGEDVYEETGDIIFFPRVLTVPPGEERLLRAGYKFPAINSEKTYRLFIEEIPSTAPGQASAVLVAVRFGLPIFIAPPSPLKSAEIDSIGISKGVFTAEISNAGNSHLLPSKILVSGKNDGGETVFTVPLKAWYILTGNKRSFSKKLTVQECRSASSLQFDFFSDSLHLTEQIPLAKSDCQP